RALCHDAMLVRSGPASPQSTSTDHGPSFAPGSLNEPRLKLCDAPSFELWSAAAWTTGFTLFTVTLAVYSLTPPSLSLIFPFTERTPLSVDEQLALAVPLSA